MCLIALIFVAAFHHSDIRVSAHTACTNQWSKNRMEEALITFLVPSSGRSTLAITLDSLQRQDDPTWLAIVMFDGIVSDNMYISNTSNIPTFLPLHVLQPLYALLHAIANDHDRPRPFHPGREEALQF